MRSGGSRFGLERLCRSASFKILCFGTGQRRVGREWRGERRTSRGEERVVRALLDFCDGVVEGVYTADEDL